jgi:hypothetical protein
MTDPVARLYDSLGDALPREIARVRDQVMPAYLSLRGVPGVSVEPALAMMRGALDAASKAMIEGDVVEMLRAYEELKGFKL